MAKFRNFDDYIKERNKERSVTLKLFGQTHYLPPTLPFDAALTLQSLAGRSKDEKVSDQFVTELFQKIVGNDIYEFVIKQPQFDIDLMTALMSWILEQYGLSNPEEVPNPKEQESVSPQN